MIPASEYTFKFVPFETGLQKGNDLVLIHKKNKTQHVVGKHKIDYESIRTDIRCCDRHKKVHHFNWDVPTIELLFDLKDKISYAYGPRSSSYEKANLVGMSSSWSAPTAKWCREQIEEIQNALRLATVKEIPFEN